jgi:hypothetical protein
MTEVVHTLTGMKIAGRHDFGARYYRKIEADAVIETLALISIDKRKAGFKHIGYVWEHMGDKHFSEVVPEWARQEGDPTKLPILTMVYVMEPAK